MAKSIEKIEINQQEFIFDKNVVRLIPSPDNIPTVDVQNSTLDMGYDPVLIIDDESYALRKLDSEMSYTNVDLSKKYTTSAVKVIFNKKSYSIYTIPYNTYNNSNEVTIGGIRYDIQGADAKLIFSIDLAFEYDIINSIHILKNKELYNISYNPIQASNYYGYMINDYRQVNIDTVNKTIYFPNDFLLCVQNNYYSTTYSTIPYYVEDNPTGAIKIVYDTKEQKICTRPYYVFDKYTITIGTIRCEYESHYFLKAEFPFYYTINGIPSEQYYNPQLSTRVLNAKTNMKYIAHRGYHLSNVPENSLDAYRLAGYCGFDMAETDFGATSDNVLVLMHDDTINRTCRLKSEYATLTETVSLDSITYEELTTKYVLASDDKRYRQQVPTLEEYFITCRDSGIFPVPEIKSTGMTNENIKQAFEIGKRIMGEENFGFCSFSYNYLDYARSLSDKITLLYIGNSIIDTTNTITNQSRETKQTIWYPSYSSYGFSAEEVVKYKQRGLKVAVWTCPVSQFDTLMKAGVDYIATDYISPNINGAVSYKVSMNGNDRELPYTNGRYAEKILTLQNGQLAKITNNMIYDMGGYYLSISYKGNIKIQAPNLTIEHQSDKVERVIYQGLISNSGSTVTITSLEDNSEIHFLEYADVEFLN